jgi:trehalose-6-phosphatase
MLAAAPKTTPKPPTPPTPPKDMIDMATPAELADAFEQGIDQYNGRFYSDKGTGGIYHQQEVQYRADVLAAMQRQTDALNALAAALGKPNQ